VLQANFLREDLPYFTELLAEVLSQTRYTSASYTFSLGLSRRGQGVLIVV
jgi:hypothetical protein